MNYSKIDNPKIIHSWAMYDWANSVYNLVITSTIFPAYYEGITTNVTNNNVINFLGYKFINTALYNYALAFAFIIVAVISPILSSIADYKGNKKSFLRFFSTLGSICCCLLFFFTTHNIVLGFIFFILACIGFWGSLVFYNSYLPEIASEAKRDDVSAKGFSYGYIGSVILQLLCFVVIFKKEWFGIAKDNELLAPQISFILTGIWWLGFSQIPLKNLPKGFPELEKPEHNIFINGFIELKKVVAVLKQMKVLKQFLISYFFYNMGVQTIMLVAALFGKKILNIPTPSLILIILIIQLVAIPGALLIAKISDSIGNFKTLLIVILAWVFICLSSYFITSQTQFFVLAFVVGFVMGGVQSLSRSTYAKLIPSNRDTTSFFSFFDVTEKIAIAIGLLSYGFIEEFSGSMRKSTLVVMMYFIIGLIILLPLYNKKIGT